MSRLFLYSWQIQGDHINLYPPGKTTMGRLENHPLFLIGDTSSKLWHPFFPFFRQSCSFSRAGGTSYWVSYEANCWVEGGRQPIQDGWFGWERMTWNVFFRIGFCIVRGRFLAGFLLRSVVSLVNFSHGSACQTPLKPFRCHASLTWDISFEN